MTREFPLSFGSQGVRQCLILLLCLLLAGCEWEEHTEDMGYKGAARYNPLLAAEMMCEQMALPGQSLPGFTGWPDEDDVYTIVLPAAAFIEGQLSPEAAVDFLEDGGNLIVYFSGVMGHAELRQNIIDVSPYKKARGLSNFLNSCGISLVIDQNDLDAMYVDADRRIERFIDLDTNTVHEVSISSVIQFGDIRRKSPLISRADVKSREAGQTQPIVSVNVRRGRLTLISDGRWMTQKPVNEIVKTPAISELNHASLLWRLVYPDAYYGIDRVQFVYGLQKGFIQLLFKYGWMAILPLTIWLVLWLWQGLIRFERIAESESEDKRDFSEHIRATGRYWWRHNCQKQMIDQLRTHAFARIRRRWPHASALLQAGQGGNQQNASYDLAHENMMKGLVAMTGMPQQTLEAALTGPVAGEADEFISVVKQLKHINASL